MLDKPFYTYTLAYPQSMGGAVFYVGRGSGDRINEHEREARRGVQSKKSDIIRDIEAHSEQVVKIKVFETAIEQDSCRYEQAMIIMIALRNPGQLANILIPTSALRPPMPIRSYVVARGKKHRLMMDGG